MAIFRVTARYPYPFQICPSLSYLLRPQMHIRAKLQQNGHTRLKSRVNGPMQRRMPGIIVRIDQERVIRLVCMLEQHAQNDLAPRLDGPVQRGAQVVIERGHLSPILQQYPDALLVPVGDGVHEGCEAVAIAIVAVYFSLEYCVCVIV